MKTVYFDDHQKWLDARKAKITGSKLKDIITLRGNGKKKGYYQLIADRMMHTMPVEDPRERGHRLEQEAIDLFTQDTSKPVDTSLQMWQRKDNQFIAISPDGYIESEAAAVEVKCLDGAGHIQALITKVVPNEYKFQTYQYFIVNDTLERLYVVFYNPQMIKHKLFYLEITRKSVEGEIDKYLKEQELILKEVEEIVSDLTF